MLKVFEKIFPDNKYERIRLLEVSQNNHILSIVLYRYNNNTNGDEYCLFKIDMKSMMMIKKLIFNISKDTHEVFKIINSKIYYISSNHLFSVDIETYEINKIIYVPGNRVFTFLKFNDEPFQLVHRGDSDNSYIEHMLANETLAVLSSYDEEYDEDNDEIVNVKIYDPEYATFHFGDVFAFYNLKLRKMIYYNINTKRIEEIDADNTIGKHIYNIGDSVAIYEHGGKRIINDVKNNTHKEVNFNLDVDNSVNYIIRVFMHDDNMGYVVLENENTLNIYIDINEDINISKNYNTNLVRVGTETENVEISLDLLKDRSMYIYNTINDNSEEITELINRSYVNISMYKNFIEENICEDEQLYDLFKVCDLFEDKRIIIVADKIVQYVKKNNFDIDKSFSFLELLFISQCYNKYYKLLYIILKKYDRKLFIDRVLSNNSLFNTSIIRELISKI